MYVDQLFIPKPCRPSNVATAGVAHNFANLADPDDFVPDPDPTKMSGSR